MLPVHQNAPECNEIQRCESGPDAFPISQNFPFFPTFLGLSCIVILLYKLHKRLPLLDFGSGKAQRAYDPLSTAHARAARVSNGEWWIKPRRCCGVGSIGASRVGADRTRSREGVECNFIETGKLTIESNRPHAAAQRNGGLSIRREELTRRTAPHKHRRRLKGTARGGAPPRLLRARPLTFNHATQSRRHRVRQAGCGVPPNGKPGGSVVAEIVQLDHKHAARIDFGGSHRRAVAPEPDTPMDAAGLTPEEWIAGTKVTRIRRT